jgi:hypothetical protein
MLPANYPLMIRIRLSSVTGAPGLSGQYQGTYLTAIAQKKISHNRMKGYRLQRLCLTFPKRKQF